MNFSAVTNNISDKAKQYADSAKTTYDKTFKPFIKEQLKYAKTISKDSFEFVKNNPKKIGKYAAVTAGIVAVGAGVVKGIKDYIETKKVNKILAKFVAMEKQNNQELKNFIGVQKEMIDAKDAIIESQKKVIEEQKAKIAQN